MNIGGRDFFFRNHKKVDVVIYDRTNSYYLLDVLSTNFSCGILDLRPISIFINFRQLIGVCKFFLNFNFFRQDLSLVEYLVRANLFASIVSMNPKVVITMIDNNEEFQWLDSNISEILNIKFIAVQNGFRLSNVPINNYALTHLFCFGNYEKNNFPLLGYLVKNYYPVGSLIADLRFSNLNLDKKYDILIISCWRGNIGFNEDVKDSMNSMRIMDNLLAEYIKNKSELKVSVILRSEKGSEHWFMPELGMNEEEYYKNIYRDKIEIIQNDFHNKNVYTVISQSELLISTLSTALIEGFGIGKKSLFCNFTGTKKYHTGISSEIVFEENNYQKFSEYLDFLLSLSSDEYQTKYHDLMSYYMNFSSDSSVKNRMLDQILKIVNTASN
jgi:surface carbohydrate biosynthesis protein